MKGWICGLVIGLMMGSTVAGAAEPRWWKNVAGIVASQDDVRPGYIEGMNDTLQTLALIQGWNPDGFGAWMQRKATCLSAHTQATAEEFLGWANKTWQSGMDKGKSGAIAQAAGALIADCQ